MKNRPRFSNLILLIVLFSLTLLAYSNSFSTTFHYDDMGYIVDNVNIRDLSNISAIRKTLQEPTRFITFLSFAINYHFNKLDVFGYHLVNFIIHFLSGILVYFLILSTLFLFNKAHSSNIKTKTDSSQKDEAGFLAFIVAGIFLLHPLQTQAVTYLTQRFASLATLFYLGSLFFYIKARNESSMKAFAYWCISFLSAVLSFFSKEISFTLPAMIVLYEWLFINPGKPFSPRFKRISLIILSIFAIVIPMAMFRFNIKHILLITLPSMSHPGDTINSLTYLLTQFHVIWHYVRLFFVPIGQVLVYDFPVSTSLFEPTTFVLGLTLFGLFIFGMTQISKNRLLSFGIFWFFLTLTIESSIFPIRHVIFEHRMYLPIIGIGIFLIGLLKGQWRFSKNIIKISFIFLLILGLLTFLRNRVWRDEITLWSDVVKKSPTRSVSYANLGYAYLEGGDYDKAIENINKSIKLDPDFNPIAYNNAGLVYIKFKLYPLALTYFDRAIDMYPLYAEAHLNRGGLFEEQRKWEEALVSYNQAIKIRTDYVLAYINRGNVRGQLNDHIGAFADYDKAILLDPDAVSAYINRGNRWAKVTNYEKAILDYNRALQISPNNIDALNNRANAFNMINDFDRALNDYANVLKLNPQRLRVYYQRADLYVKMDRLTDALNDLSKAIDYNSHDGSIYLKRAEIYKKMGNNFLAQKDILMAESLLPPK